MKCDYSVKTVTGQATIGPDGGSSISSIAVTCDYEATNFYRMDYPSNINTKWFARCEAHSRGWFTPGFEITREEYLVAQVMNT